MLASLARTGHRAPILAVDDTPANLVALQALTEQLDVDLVTATSGAEAIASFAQQEFAAVLLDVMMPGLDGLETLAQLRALPSMRSTPVMFLTAVDMSRSMMRRAYSLGAVDYLTKPLDTDMVLAKLRAFVDLYHQEHEIRRQAEALESKDKHIAVLAHDLRTPLSVVAMGARILHEHEDPAVRGVSSRISRAVTRMEQLTADVLVFAQATHGKLETVKTHGDLSALCVEVVEDFRATHPTIRFDPHIDENVCGSFDVRRVQQALANLLSNAVKFGSGWVLIRVTSAGSDMRVEITNGGDPIPADRMPMLFERFERASTQPGTGLGLYIVRTIARAHGGDITVTSDEAKTAFVLRLPR